MYEYFLVNHLHSSNLTTYTKKIESLLNISSILSGISVFNSLQNNTSFYGNIIDVTNEGIVKVRTDYGIMEMASDLILFQSGMQLQFVVLKKQNELLLQLLKINNQSAKNFINYNKLYGSDIVEHNIKEVNKESLRNSIVVDIGKNYVPKLPERIREDIIQVPQRQVEISSNLTSINIENFKAILPEQKDPKVIDKIIFDLAKNTDIPELIAIMKSNPDNQDIKRMTQMMRNFINIQVQFQVLEENPDIDTPDAVKAPKEVDNDLPSEVITGHTKNANEIKVQKEIHNNIIITPKNNNSNDQDIDQNYTELDNTKIIDNTNKAAGPRVIKKPTIFEIHTTPNKVVINSDMVIEAKQAQGGFITPIGLIDQSINKVIPYINIKNPGKLLLKIDNITFAVTEKNVSSKVDAMELSAGFKYLDEFRKKNIYGFNNIDSLEKVLNEYDEDSRNIVKLLFSIPNLSNKQVPLGKQIQSFIHQINTTEIDAKINHMVNFTQYGEYRVDLTAAIDLVLHEINTIKTSLENIRETEEWQIVPLPIIYNGQVTNLNFYVKNEKEPSQSKYQRPGRTLFRIEANNTPFGNITIDGNIYNRNSNKFIDISLYAEKEIDKVSDKEIRALFDSTVKSLECDGRIKILSKKTFAQNPKSFIKNLLDNIRA